jgi:hypothetical protein
LHQDITYECIRAYYTTVNSDEEDVILRKKGTVESEYDDYLDDGDDRATGIGSILEQLSEWKWF